MTKSTVNQAQQNRQILVDALIEAGAKVRDNTINCFNKHEDKTASGGIYEDRGIYRYKCHSCGFCGDVFDVKAESTGRSLTEILKEHSGGYNNEVKQLKIYPTVESIEKTLPNRISTYKYTNPDSHDIELIIVRCESNGKKTFLQYHAVPGGYVSGGIKKDKPLYNRSRLVAADHIIVVEGEKCVLSLHNKKHVATTSPGGANSPQYADWSPLAGKVVFIWPDNDDNGLEYGQVVYQLLEKLDPPPEIYWIDPSKLNLQPKGDAADYVGDIYKVLELATPMVASKGIATIIEDTISGKRRAIPWPWPELSILTKALLPGTVTVICGNPGATKSFVLLEALAHWHDQGEKVCCFEMEEDLNFHLLRALAQKVEKSELLDDVWIRDQPYEARDLMSNNKKWLDNFGRCLWDAPNSMVNLEDLSKWVTDRAKSGYRIIAIDPITVAAKSSRSWEDDLKFVFTVKAAVRATGASLILVSHPKKGRGAVPAMEDLAGGTAYERFTPTIIWIENHGEIKEVSVRSSAGITSADINRSIHILKARNARGGGSRIACLFRADTLRLCEYGIEMTKKK